jgi:hypothetical protein
MGRALLGLIKGALIGGGIGYCLLKLGNPSGVLVYLCCGIVGAVVGLLCGRAPWHAETIWTPILKVIFGFGIGAGLYALGHRFAPGMTLTIQGFTEPTSLRSGATLAPIIGMLYGLFVEVDDGATGTTTSSKGRVKALPDGDKDL